MEIQITDEHIAILRSVLIDEKDADQKLDALGKDDRWPFMVLLTAALVEAVKRRLGGPPRNRGDLIHLVAAVRIHHGYEKFDPLATERLLRLLYGDTKVLEESTEEAIFESYLDLLCALVYDQHLYVSQVDGFLQESRKRADRLIQQLAAASPSPSD